MTAKELFVKMLETEKGAFVRVLEAVPGDKLDYRPHPRSSSAGKLVAHFPASARDMKSILENGTADLTKDHPEIAGAPLAVAAEFSAAYDELLAVARNMSEDFWPIYASMKGPKGEWKAPRGEMAVSFLCDLIHHRGQLSTYLRPMGAPVPTIYGPSGDAT